MGEDDQIAASESSPLLPTEPNKQEAPKTWRQTVIYRVLLAGFMVSLSFGVTQTPIIYVVGLMTCDEYYKHHPAHNRRCDLPSIEGSAARSIALLSGVTTVFGILNLFVTGWLIKVWGIKRTLLISTIWPAIRLLVQIVGIETGAGVGIIIIQFGQVLNVVGGPAGYMLALNSFATEVVLPVDRTSTLGRLSGCCMFGTALGFLLGGLLGDWYGIIAPFRVSLILFCVSAAYAYFALPDVALSSNAGVAKKKYSNLGAFFQPLKIFIPRLWILQSGAVRREYGILLLGTGTFLAVFATAFIPILLQMYATDVFGFGTMANSELISLNFAIRALFLTFAFPKIISAGRSWLEKRCQNKRKVETDTDSRCADDVNGDHSTRRPSLAGETSPGATTSYQANSSNGQSGSEGNPSFDFDLLYTRYSLLLDSVLTSLATFTWQGWQMYLVAAILPFGSGTGSAAKGTMLQMCTPEEKTDALSAISVLESMGKLSSASLFGLIFSGFAEVWRPNLTFAVNSGVALIGFLVLLIARFPPPGTARYNKLDNSEE